MPAQQQRPFFIVGCPRSGTSVLARMLGTHPNLAIPYESHLYNRIYPAARRYGDLSDPSARARLVGEILRTDYIRQWTPPPPLADTLSAIRRDDFHGIVDGLMRAWTATQGKGRWGEKTPQHMFWWETIRAGFPDFQMIHVVRDGRDVALSYRAAHFGPKHVYALAQRWAEYLSAAQRAEVSLGPDAFLVVRYEELMAAPEAELRRICRFLGEEFAPEMLGFYRADVLYPTDRRNLDNLRRPLLTENSGKWRSRMSPRELRLFEAVAGALLERHGYPRTLANPRVPGWEAWSCRYLEHPARRVLSLIANRQGQRLTLETLRLHLRPLVDMLGRRPAASRVPVP